MLRPEPTGNVHRKLWITRNQVIVGRGHEVTSLVFAVTDVIGAAGDLYEPSALESWTVPGSGVAQIFASFVCRATRNLFGIAQVTTLVPYLCNEVCLP